MTLSLANAFAVVRLETHQRISPLTNEFQMLPYTVINSCGAQTNKMGLNISEMGLNIFKVGLSTFSGSQHPHNGSQHPRNGSQHLLKKVFTHPKMGLDSAPIGS